MNRRELDSFMNEFGHLQFSGGPFDTYPNEKKYEINSRMAEIIFCDRHSKQNKELVT